MNQLVWYQHLPVSVMSGVGTHWVQIESWQFEYQAVTELCFKVYGLITHRLYQSETSPEQSQGRAIQSV